MKIVTLAVNPPQYHGDGDRVSGTRIEGTLLAEPVRRIKPKSDLLLKFDRMSNPKPSLGIGNTLRLKSVK